MSLIEHPSQEAERHVAAVLAALSLLDCFDQDVTLRLRDLHERTGIQKSRILRLTGSLVSAGYLQDERGGGYRLGPRVLALGQIVTSNTARLAGRIRPVLERLCAELGDTCFFSVIRGTERLVLEKVAPAAGLLYTIPQGELRPLHRGASGRVLLAFASGGLRHRVVAALTAADESGAHKSELDEFERDAALALSQGFLLSVGQLTAHAFALAVPVFDEDRVLLGALTIAGPENKVSPKQAPELASCIRQAIEHAGFLSHATRGEQPELT